MLVKADSKAIEWRIKADLSQDKTAIEEILNNIDQHTANQKEFKLPSRLIAKIFVFRMIYADAFGEQGFNKPAWSYANDPDFSKVSDSTKFWANVVERFFKKYPGMYSHGFALIEEAKKTGKIVVPSKRFYPFAPRLIGGEYRWPHSDILNYPVQGFAAEAMQLTRIYFWKQLKKGNYKKVHIINTVHDDLELDVDNDPKLLYNISILLEDSFAKGNDLIKENYGYSLAVPLLGEIKVGPNLYEASMIKFDRSLGEKQYESICN